MQGLEDPDAVGEDYNVEEADDGPRPFTALLDTGLKRTSTGSKVFAALKVRGRVEGHGQGPCIRNETSCMHLLDCVIYR